MNKNTGRTLNHYTPFQNGATDDYANDGGPGAV